MNLKYLYKNPRYLIPNTFTALNMIFGIVSILESRPLYAYYYLLFSLVLDNWDGLAARYFNAGSSFGEQFDSLSDLVSFGVAPAVLCYKFFSTDSLTVILIIYVLSIAIRLARFNTSKVNSAFFEGLPSPASAAAIISYMFLCHAYQLHLSSTVHYLYIGIISFLTISTIPFPAVFKKFFSKKIYMMSVVICFYLSISVIQGPAPFIMSTTYLITSLLYAFIKKPVL
jgi:CDP-diacylglycerol--serine O-phosphatidyltransferase